MESQPQNPEFRINPETFDHVIVSIYLRKSSRMKRVKAEASKRK